MDSKLNLLSANLDNKINLLTANMDKTFKNLESKYSIVIALIGALIVAVVGPLIAKTLF
jgi:hypothetical protein